MSQLQSEPQLESKSELQLESMSEDKLQIMKSILDNNGTYDYQRMNAYNKKHGFKNYEHFVTHNEQCVKNLSDDDVKFVKMLIDKMKKDEICQADEEDCIEWDSYKVYYNIHGKIVIMHPG